MKKKKSSWKLWAVLLGVFVLLGLGSRSGSKAPEPSRAATDAVDLAEAQGVDAPEDVPVYTAAPTRAPTPEPTETPEPTATPHRIHGRDPQTEVYVSRQGVIHFRADCSGMKYYTAMSLEQADAAGYKYCEHCG